MQKAIEKWVKVALESSPVRILEIGVGRRTFYDRLKKESPQMEYIGIEASDTLYEDAKSKGINVIKCFVPPFPRELEAASFDLVVMIHVLEHFRDFREALEVLCGIGGLLAPNGRLLLICPCARDYGMEFFDADYSHSFITTENRVNELLQDAGFQTIKRDSYRACFNHFKIFFYIVSRIVNALAFFLRNGSYRSIKVKTTLSKNLLVVAQKADAPPPPPTIYSIYILSVPTIYGIRLLRRISNQSNDFDLRGGYIPHSLMFAACFGDAAAAGATPTKHGIARRFTPAPVLLGRGE